MEIKKPSTSIIVFCSLCIGINIVGSFLCFTFRLPIYLDSIGTILSAIIAGPIYGALVGAMTNLVTGITYDSSAIYYIPTQIGLGFLTGLFIDRNNFGYLKDVGIIILITLICSLISSLITTFVFSGITSSGSTYITSLLRLAGINLLSSVMSVQILTDLLDKLVCFWLDFFVIKRLPKSYLNKL